jgi:hypothetical protein
VLRKHFSHDADEYGVLCRSVAEHGLIGIAITLDAAGHSVIDGWSRYCAWKEACRHDDRFAELHPLAPHVEVRVFATDKERIEFMLFQQHGRRNLTAIRTTILNRSAASAPLQGTCTALPTGSSSAGSAQSPWNPPAFTGFRSSRSWSSLASPWCW